MLKAHAWAGGFESLPLAGNLLTAMCNVSVPSVRADQMANRCSRVSPHVAWQCSSDINADRQTTSRSELDRSEGMLALT